MRSRRFTATLLPALVLATALVAAVACQESEASPAGPPGEPRSVAQGADPTEGGLFAAFRDRKPISLRIPEGTGLAIRLLQPLSTRVTRRGQGFQAEIAEDLVLAEGVAIRSGAMVTGTVHRSGRLPAPDGRPHLALSFDAVELPSGGSAPLLAYYLRTGTDGTAVDAGVGARLRRTALTLPAGAVFEVTLERATTVEIPRDPDE